MTAANIVTRIEIEADWSSAPIALSKHKTQPGFRFIQKLLGRLQCYAIGHLWLETHVQVLLYISFEIHSAALGMLWCTSHACLLVFVPDPAMAFPLLSASAFPLV